MVRSRGLLGLAHADEQEDLVGAIGKAVQGFGQHRPTARKEGGHGLGQRDTAVRAQRVKNGLQ